MGFLEERDFSYVQSIPEFYKGKTIFITGGTGFMGKVLIEKLLYSCSDLDRIYLLVRNKKGVKSEDRLDSLYASQCFDRLRKERPDVFKSKVFIIAGDVMELGLGLSEEDRTLLINRVNIVFHVAASVRFDDPLAYAVKLNLRGTREMVELAKEIKDLSVFIHVSTSYSNTNRDTIEEIMYPPHADWRDTIAVCENTDEHTLKVMTAKYLGELPNTYTFSKQLAEHVVYEQRGKLPISIVRPSIVISSVQEPSPGWLENFNGPVGILIAGGKGILRSVYTDPDLVADYMPVDISIKSIIAAAWIRGTKPIEPTDDIAIYNCCAGNLNTMTMGEILEVGHKITAALPLNDMLWTVGGNLTTSKTLHFVKVIFLHLLPAVIIDTILRVLGKKPLLVKIQRRIYIANLALEYYITQQWTFKNDNLIKLRSTIKQEDIRNFYYNMEDVDKYQYFYDGVAGGRRYLLKEKDEDLPKARAHYRRIMVLDKILKCIFYGCLLWWILKTNFVQSILETTISML